jgi:hypothetical protein
MQFLPVIRPDDETGIDIFVHEGIVEYSDVV